jgi:hypothetical protein
MAAVEHKSTAAARCDQALFKTVCALGIKVLRDDTGAFFLCILRLYPWSRIKTVTGGIELFARLKRRCDVALVDGVWRICASGNLTPHHDSVFHACLVAGVNRVAIYQAGKDVVSPNFDDSDSDHCVGGIYYFPLVYHYEFVEYLFSQTWPATMDAFFALGKEYWSCLAGGVCHAVVLRAAGVGARDV